MRRNNLEKAKVSRDIAAEHLQELESQSFRELYKGFRDERTKAINRVTDRVKRANTEAFLLETNARNAQRIPAQHRQTLLAQLKQDRNELVEKLNKIRQDIAQLEKDIKLATHW